MVSCDPTGGAIGYQADKLIIGGTSDVHRIWQRCLAVLLVFCLAWVVSGGAQAAAAVVVPDVTDEIMSLSTKAQPYMQRNKDGTYTLTASAKDLGVSQLAVDRFTGALATINDAVRHGYLTIDDKEQVHVTDAGRRAVTPTFGCTNQARRLNETQTIQLEGVFTQYSAGLVALSLVVSFVAAMMFTGPVAVLLALAFVLGIMGATQGGIAGWMMRVDQGQGITIRWTQCPDPWFPFYHDSNYSITAN